MLAVFAAFAMLQPVQAALDDELREANRLHRAGQSDAALAKIDAYLATQPKEAQMRFLKAVVLTDTGRTGDAATMLVQLTQDFPELPEPHNNLAALRALQGDWDGARAELQQSIRLNPAFAPAHENLGDVQSMLALESYRRAQRLEPASTTLPRKLALVRELTAPMAARPVAAASAASPAAALPPAAAASSRRRR